MIARDAINEATYLAYKIAARVAAMRSPVPPVRWGEEDPHERGPLICLDLHSRTRNSIGQYGAAYGHFRAAAQAAGRIPRDHIPNYTDTVSQFRPPKNKNWFGDTAIASFDPFGHLVPELFAEQIVAGYNVRPTIAITPAKLNFLEVHHAIAKGVLEPDDTILQKNGRINVTKIAIEPVWHLPGIAKYYDIDERTLREGLFWGLGGAHRGLIWREDLKTYLPAHGETTVYVVGDFTKLGDPDVVHAARTHDKCGSSDTHRANICSCAPALMWGYEQAVLTAQAGGIGLIVYTEAEGRGHGVVPKNLVYNKRSSGLDLPKDYFDATASVTGIADLREQMIPTDVYRWLGIEKINIWMSGSPHKNEAMERAGIKIMEERPLPQNRVDKDTGLIEWIAKQRYGGYHYAERLIA